jgi:tetratricopeptide (TPR) repeat protein
MQRLFFMVLLSLALASTALGQKPTAPFGANDRQAQEEQAEYRVRAAITELQEAARAYRAGDFAGAQRHSERALEINPEERNAPAFIARSIHAQFRHGSNTPENTAKAHEAIAAYQRMLDRWPDNEEAYNAIGFLYGAIHEDEKQLDWIRRRALDSSAAPEKRAEAYVFLASKSWHCSFRVTEDKANKYTLVGAKGKKTPRFKMPDNPDDFQRASLCTNKGLEEVKMAIALSPDNEKAWGYQGALLYEAQKLAEMEGDIKKARKFWREGEKVRKRAHELTTKKRADEASDNSATAP